MNALSGVSAHRAAGIAAEHAASVDQDGRFPAEAIAALKADGLMSAMIPRELGGQGMLTSGIASACNLIARQCASTAMIFAMHQIQVACLVRHALRDDWHRTFARRVVAEQWLIASMTSEIGVGGNLRVSRCGVRPTTPGRFELEKQTPTMSYGDYADAYFASCRRGLDSAPSDQVFVAVLRQDTVLIRTGGWDGLGLRGTCSEGFDLRAQGDRAQVFSTPFADIATETMLPISHLFWAAIWLGIAGDAVERARAYLRDQARRNPGVVPPGAPRLAQAAGNLQLVQARLRDLLQRYDACMIGDAALDFGALSMDADLNALKLDASGLCRAAVEQAMMICGMAGYRNGGPYSLGRHLRDMWSAPLMIGNDRVAANTGAMLLAGRGELGGI